MTDAARIAKRLSKAQRNLLMSATETIGGEIILWHHGRHEAPFAVLVRLSLARRRIGIADCLTPLGIAVREILQSEKSA